MDCKHFSLVAKIVFNCLEKIPIGCKVLVSVGSQ